MRGGFGAKANPVYSFSCKKLSSRLKSRLHFLQKRVRTHTEWMEPEQKHRRVRVYDVYAMGSHTKLG